MLDLARSFLRLCPSILAAFAIAACDSGATGEGSTSEDSADSADAADAADATDAADANDGADTPDAGDSSDATDGTGNVDATDGTGNVDATDSADSPDGSDSTDASDSSADSAEGTDGAADSTDLADATDGSVDGPVDATDGLDANDGIIESCEGPEAEIVRSVALPLGETLFFGGDDYLAFWSKGAPCEPVMFSLPGGSTAAFAGETEAGDRRLTPDAAGTYVIDVGNTRVEVTVIADGLTSDTFLNYNYTPESPIVLFDADTLFVASPPSNAVQKVTLSDTGATLGALIPTGAWPTSVKVWGGFVLVAQSGRDTLGFLDPATGRIVDAIKVGNEPMGLEVFGDTALVALAAEHRVVKVDLLARTIVGSVDVGREPRAMVLDAAGGRLFVASLISSNQNPHGKAAVDAPVAIVKDIAIVDIESMSATFTPEVGTILRGLWLSADGTKLRVGLSHSLNLGAEIAADSTPHAHGIATIDVTDDQVTTADITQLNLDENVGAAGPSASPMTMTLSPEGDVFLVTLSAGNAVLVLDSTDLHELARYEVGNDPRGMVFAHGRLWTYAWLDNQLVGIDVSFNAQSHKEPVSLEVGADPTPMDVKQGQRMFNDAFFSKNHDFSCNNCHIDGLTDGLVWNLLVDGDVNTLAFRNVGGTGPFLWGGQLPTLFDFSREVLKLVGADASGEEMELLTRYMQSVTAPPNPYAAPGGQLTESGEIGRLLFEGQAGCSACHSGPLFTNQTTVEGKTEGLYTDVPSLIGVYDTAPYGRKGQWMSMEDMIERATEFTGAVLTDTELGALADYVRQIPGDALYLNSATPLNGDNHVWNETPIELVFSQVLKPGQEDFFTILEVKGLGSAAPLAGAWSISGRVARFKPDAFLPLDTAYQITVKAGVIASLGQKLHQPLLLNFRTGNTPLVDVSGKWVGTLTVEQPIQGSIDVELAFLQSKGGKVAGVILSYVDEAKVSHLEGIVSGSTFVLTPFQADTDFGPVTLEGGQVELTDVDQDGFADTGTGSITALGYFADFDLKRKSLPESD